MPNARSATKMIAADALARAPPQGLAAGKSSLHAVPDVLDVTTEQCDWWWRENAAQAA